MTVVETQTGWMRVRTVGPVFEGWGAYVPALPGVTLSADGKTIKITGTAPINAPNDTADFNPDRSWKAIGYLTTGDELPVLDVIKGEHDTFYAVPLTAKTSGWISETALTRKDSNAPKTETKIAPRTEPKTETKPETTTDTKPELTSDVVIETATEIVATTTTDTTKTAKITRNKPVAKPEEPKTPSAAQLARAKFEPLEATWKSLAKETCSTGDLQELHVSFLAIAEDNTALQSTRMNARARSTQIATILELRGLKERMREVANRQKLETQEVADLEKWLLARQQYDAVGVLNASLVYDGVRLPRLYRLQDPVSGFTTAYLMEDSELKLSSMLGLVIGVKGPVHFDESLRRNLITPKTAAVIQAGKEVEISSATEPTANSKAASDSRRAIRPQAARRSPATDDQHNRLRFGGACFISSDAFVLPGRYTPRRWGVSSIGRAMPLQGIGYRFEPGTLHFVAQAALQTSRVAHARRGSFAESVPRMLAE